MIRPQKSLLLHFFFYHFKPLAKRVDRYDFLQGVMMKGRAFVYFLWLESLSVLAMKKFRPLVSDNCLGDTNKNISEMMECEQMRDPIILCSLLTKHLFPRSASWKGHCLICSVGTSSRQRGEGQLVFLESCSGLDAICANCETLAKFYICHWNEWGSPCRHWIDFQLQPLCNCHKHTFTEAWLFVGFVPFVHVLLMCLILLVCSHVFCIILHVFYLKEYHSIACIPSFWSTV